MNYMNVFTNLAQDKRVSCSIVALFCLTLLLVSPLRILERVFSVVACCAVVCTRVAVDGKIVATTKKARQSRSNVRVMLIAFFY